MLGRARFAAAAALGAWLALPALPARAEEAAGQASAPAEAAPPAAATAVPAVEGEARATGRPKRPRKHRRERAAADGPELGLPVRATASAGALSGEGTLRERGAVTLLGVDARPYAEAGQWRLQVPLSAEHREALGAPLDETRGEVELEARWRRGPELRLEASLGVRGVWRPDWPDQYQPLADGSLAATDRYSHWDRRAGLALAAIPWRHQHVRLSYAYTLVDQAQDPAFDAVDEPTHLVPGDRDVHELDASWRWYEDGWNAGVELEASRTGYFFQFARDAGTGKTHAGAGGPPPNPLFVSLALEPQLVGSVELVREVLELDLGYGVELVDDVYQGYYSYVGHHPSAKLTWRHGRLELGGRADVHLRRYGEGSYAAGPGHPPLAYGDRRVDRRGTGAVSARWELSGAFALVAEAGLTVRRTNFPDYVAGVYPVGRQYDIAWSYENWIATAGIELRR